MPTTNWYKPTSKLTQIYLLLSSWRDFRFSKKQGTNVLSNNHLALIHKQYYGFVRFYPYTSVIKDIPQFFVNVNWCTKLAFIKLLYIIKVYVKCTMLDTNFGTIDFSNASGAVLGTPNKDTLY